MKGTDPMTVLTDESIATGLSDLPAPEPPSDLTPNILYRTGLADLCWQSASPIGPIFVAASLDGITAVDRSDSAESFMSGYRDRFGRDVRFVEQPPARLARGVERLLAGDRQNLPPFDLSHSTPFEAAVLRKALEIPRGQVRPYNWIAREIGSPKASRAVGSALAGNPIPLLIPCHRVVRGDGVIGNYIFGTEVKRSLLTEERANIDRLEAFGKTGIRFVGSDTTHIFCFPTCRYQPKEEHLQFFHSEAEARARGYRPCKVCRPAVAS
jgi:methylated-DNA-[protein]-cysteine S-methyltransferase